MSRSFCGFVTSICLLSFLVFYSAIAERSRTQRNAVVQNLYSARFDPEENVYISAWCIPFRMIFAPFERPQSQLSIGAKITQNGGHHAEIQPRFVKGAFPEEYKNYSGMPAPLGSTKKKSRTWFTMAYNGSQ